MSGRSFGRDLRLTEAADYRQVFNSPDYRISTGNVLLLARNNHLTLARLGLAVAKKNVPLAVTRNQIKRLVREAFRINQQILAGLDIVFLCRSGLIRQGRSEQQQQISAAFLKLGHKYTLVPNGVVE